MNKTQSYLTSLGVGVCIAFEKTINEVVDDKSYMSGIFNVTLKRDSRADVRFKYQTRMKETSPNKPSVSEVIESLVNDTLIVGTSKKEFFEATGVKWDRKGIAIYKDWYRYTTETIRMFNVKEFVKLKKINDDDI